MTIFQAAWWIMLHFLHCKRNVYPLVICLAYNPVILKKNYTNEQQAINEEVKMKSRSSPFLVKVK